MSNQSMGINKSRLHFAAIIVLFVALLVIPAQAAEIHGQKWNDLDGDGVKDPNEPGVPNVWISLFPSGPIIIGPGDPETYNASTLTDSDGNYSFTNVPGNTNNVRAYEIAENIPFDWIQTYPYYYECPNCTQPITTHIVSVANDTIITGLDFGNRQLSPPPPDVTIVGQQGEQAGIPTVYLPDLTELVIKKNLSSYNVSSVNLTMIWTTWGGLTTKTVSMAENDTPGIWEASIPPPYPGGTATMTFEVDVVPPGNFPGPEDLFEYGDIIFVDPSGTIYDDVTENPINGAIVTLYVYDSMQDLFVPCPSEMILGSASNTQITGIDGKYAWITAEGIYNVSAVKAGYQMGWSGQVTVPPPQTGIDIYLQPTGVMYPLDIELTQVQIFPHGADKIQIQGIITLDGASDGIDPVSDGINIRLFLPTGIPESNQFYPTKNNIMPVYLQAVSGGWSINSSEKYRTGIQDLKILQTKDPAVFTFILVDTKSALVTDDYQNVMVDVYSGNDVGIIDVTLTENNSKYTL